MKESTKKIDGVSEATVNYAIEKLAISYDLSRVRLIEVKYAIEKVG